MNNADDLDKTMTLGNKNRKYAACVLSMAKPNEMSKLCGKLEMLSLSVGLSL